MNLDQIKNLPLSVIAAGNGFWRYSWESAGDGSVYRVTLDGRLLIVTTALSYTTADYAASPPNVEVSNTPMAVGEAHQSRLIFQWWPVEDAAYYDVQRWDDPDWVSVAIIMPDITPRSFVTPKLGDGTSAVYRVLAYNAAGAASSPLSLTRTVVCPPSAPAVTVAYDGADITVEAV